MRWALATWFLPMLLTGLGAVAAAAEPAPTGSDAPSCLSCHTASSDVPVHAIFRTAHAGIGAGADMCVGCHGASTEHQQNPTNVSPSVSFGPHWQSPADAQAGVCLGCHEQNTASFWIGSVHHDEDLACTSCHQQLHRRDDPVQDRVAQSQTCFGCHKTVQSSVHLQSRHPILEGRTACVDCHDPHGAMTTAALVEPTLNDTCYQCHAENRGPFLFEHAPATEDCSLCHRPHGSVNPALLSSRGPFLCQQCHAAAFHPSQLYDGGSLPSGQPSQYMLGSNCLSCHSQVHGSNHPAGARLTR